MGITSLGTDINFGNIVNALMEVEQLPLSRLETKRNNYVSQLDNLKKVDALLSNVLTSLTSLSTAVTEEQYSITSSSTSVVTVASTSDDAVSGVWQVNVSQLAQAGQVISGAFTTSPYTVNSSNADGSLYLTVGTYTFNVDIDGNDTPQTIADKINQSDYNNNLIDAAVLTAGSSSSPVYYLVLTSSNSGSAYAITAEVDIFGVDGSDKSGALGSFTTMTTAQDLNYTISGTNSGATSYAINSSSNNSSPLPGVNLSFQSTGAATVTVSQDNSAERTGISTAMENFLTYYNVLIDNLNYNYAATQDQTYANMRTMLRQTNSASYGPSSSSSINYLSALGVTTQSPTTLYDSSTGLEYKSFGILNIDLLEFNSVLADNRTGVDNFLASASGYIYNLKAVINGFSEAGTGILSNKEELLDDEADALTLKIQKEEERLISVNEGLVKRFAATEAAVNKFNRIGDMMESSLKSLIGNKD